MAKTNEATTQRCLWLLAEIAAFGTEKPRTLKHIAERIRATGAADSGSAEDRTNAWACIAELVRLLAEAGEKADDSPGFAPIDTGVQLPRGCITHEGHCKQCGARRICTTIKLQTSIGDVDIAPICAECVADFIHAGPSTGAKVYLQTAQGFQMVGVGR